MGKKKKKAEDAVMGRPTIYSIELAKEICVRLAEGESLRTICKDEHMPCRATIMFWLLDEDKKDFLDLYEKARDIQADNMVDEILDIADDGENDYMTRYRGEDDYVGYEVVNTEHIQRSRLRVDARKFVASKLKPRKYGDKLDLTSDGEKFPTPLLAHAVLDHNSDKEGSGAE